MQDENISYRLYGRQKDKPLKPSQERVMADLLPKIAIGPEHVKRDGVEALVDGEGQPYQKVWLEIGFGGGEHLAWQAAQNPDTLCIGAEPFLNGVAKCLLHIEAQNLPNVRILHGDVRPFLEQFPSHTLDGLFVLHPDPWPKKRHFKRRIISPFLMQQAARLLKAGSEFRVASDIPDYIRWTLMHLQMHNQISKDFEWQATQMTDWMTRPDDWPQTRYETKAIREGRTPRYLKFTRL